MPLEGNRLSIGNALALCYARGFTGRTRLITAVCVMSAESARYTRAYNINTDGSVDRGLFQINSIHGHDPELLFDPRANTDIAFKMWKNRGFTPWAAFNNGAHEKFWVLVYPVWLLGRWRNKIEKWTG